LLVFESTVKEQIIELGKDISVFVFIVEVIEDQTDLSVHLSVQSQDFIKVIKDKIVIEISFLVGDQIILDQIILD